MTIAEINRTCRTCGCTDAQACTGPDGQPCHWVMDDLCSACAEKLDLAPYAVIALDDGTHPSWLAERLNSFAALGYHVVGLTRTFIVLEHGVFAASRRLAEYAQLAEVARGASDLVVPGR